MYFLSYLGTIFFATIVVTSGSKRWEIKVGGYKYMGDDAWMGLHAFLEIDQGDGYKYHHLLRVKDSSGKFAIDSVKEMKEKFFSKTGALFKSQSFTPKLYTTYSKEQLEDIGKKVINGRPHSPFGYNCMHFVLQYVRAIAEPGSFHGRWPTVFHFSYTYYLNDPNEYVGRVPKRVDPHHPIDMWEKRMTSDVSYLTSHWDSRWGGDVSHVSGVHDDVKDRIKANRGPQTGWAKKQIMIEEAGPIEEEFTRAAAKEIARVVRDRVN